MARQDKIIIDHEDGLASLATWWKAIFLTPIWAFLLVLPLGAFIRFYFPAQESVAFFCLLATGCMYFVRDLAKRRVVIDDKNIHFGMVSAPLTDLQSIQVETIKTLGLPVPIPKSLLLNFSDKQTIRLMLSRLRDSDLAQLIEIVGRRVGHCKIDPEVEDILNRRKPPSILRLENPDKLEVKYHDHHILEELPAVLRNTIYRWSRLVGPVGTFIICLPIWLTFNHQLFTILRNYNDIPANEEFYLRLVQFLNQLMDFVSKLLNAGSGVDKLIAAAPVMAFFCIVMSMYFVRFALTSLLGANRLTLDQSEISLDRFFYLFSYTAVSAKWKDVTEVLLAQPGGTADPNQAQIKFQGKNDRTIMSIKLSALDARDREKLLLAISKFAEGCHIASSLTEALTPSNDRSYTELWLKSLSETQSRKNLEPLAPGHLLENSRYEIASKLAVGGEGVAYLGRDMKHVASGRVENVVLKETLIPPFVDKQVQQKALERFEREARLLKELKSEFVVGLRDYFIEDHRCYLVLDFVEGKNLRQYIAEHGALDESEVMELAAQMCTMLSFLHERQIIHRDFTPDNLILQEDGRLKLIDFNVARESDEGKTGTIVGKHAYVPPEQFRGKPTRQSDIYALGATLHFLLTGADPEPISQSRPGETRKDLNAALNDLVSDCTALDCNSRLQSVDDVSERCSKILATDNPPPGGTIKFDPIENKRRKKVH